MPTCARPLARAGVRSTGRFFSTSRRRFLNSSQICGSTSESKVDFTAPSDSTVPPGRADADGCTLYRVLQLVDNDSVSVSGACEFFATVHIIPACPVIHLQLVLCNPIVVVVTPLELDFLDKFLLSVKTDLEPLIWDVIGSRHPSRISMR